MHTVLIPTASFRMGFYTNILNPKTAAFVSSLYAASIPAGASLALGILCISTVWGISALWYCLVAVIFSGERQKRFTHA